LTATDNPQVIAYRLTREAWLKRGGENDFNRPLVYGPSGGLTPQLNHTFNVAATDAIRITLERSANVLRASRS